MSEAAGRPAIFIDRDGTLNEPVGFVNHLSLFKLFPWTVEAIRLVNRAGYLAVVVTNQAGVARGIFSEELLNQVHRHLEEQLQAAGAHLDKIYYCPHWPHGRGHPYRRSCDCRKPKPGMLRRAERELGIDLSRSHLIGDSYSDLQMAWAAGARASLVLTGFGRGGLEHQGKDWPRQPDAVAENLYLAVADILAGSGLG
jgi:D-glycero-D-manno-heptose 1,7-bisphosphate phosphatase